MDPLSVTASVIACLQATSAVISVCLDYRSALKHTPWGLSKVTEEVRDLRNVLESLQSVADRLESQTLTTGPEDKKRYASLQLLCSPERGPLQNCTTELNQLENILCPPKWSQNLGKRHKALIQAAGWRMKDSEVKEYLKSIERYKTTLNLALTADEAVLLVDIQSLSLSVKTSVATMEVGLTSFIQDQQIARLDERHKAILSWLTQTGPEDAQIAVLSAHQKEKSDWIFDSEEFKRWVKGERATLWLSGFPGAGKTTLFSKVVQYLQLELSDHPGSGRLAFFFCDFRSAGSQESCNVIGSLVAQLCTQAGWFPPEVETSYNNSMNSAGKSMAPTLPMLVGALGSLSEQSNIVLLLDALDESRSPAEIANVLTHVTQKNSNIKAFLTSRDDSSVRSILEGSIRIPLEIKAYEISDDIRAYIQTRLDGEEKLQWLSPSVKGDIQSVLLSKAGGMFRWVQCQIDQICPLRTVRSIRKALNDLPEGLDDTYQRILLKVPKQNADIVRRILQWLSFVIRPLALWELHDAIAIDPELDYLDDEARLSSPQDVMDLCSSLANVSNSGTVRLAHASVKEYLLSKEIRSSPAADFALEQGNSMLDIARCYLAYLSFEEFSSGPVFSHGGFEQRLARFPLLNHAAVAWPYHVLAAGEPPELNEDIQNFLGPSHRKTFMSWVQVLNALPVRGVNIVSAWDSYPRHPTPLYYAASFGLYQTVNTFIEAGVDLDAPGSRFGGTALHGAVTRHHMPIIKLLLDAGANVNQPDFNGIAPIHTATWHEENEIRALLVKYGAMTDDLEGPWSDSDYDGYMDFDEARVGREIDVVLPGNQNIERHIKSSDNVQSFDIFSQ